MRARHGLGLAACKHLPDNGNAEWKWTVDLHESEVDRQSWMGRIDVAASSRIRCNVWASINNTKNG